MTVGITILYSTQSGRAKACARRAARLLQYHRFSTSIYGNCSFDDFGVSNFLSLGNHSSETTHLLLLFVSTTGDGEHTTSIANTWSALLSKSLSPTLLSNVSFALFALGDRAYGDAFCAAGRKLAARLVQLGASPKCVVGYGDDGSDAGVLGDLDGWLKDHFFGVVEDMCVNKEDNDDDTERSGVEDTSGITYSVEIETSEWDDVQKVQEWQNSDYRQQYAEYFQQFCPDTAYEYNSACARFQRQENVAHPSIDGSPHHYRRTPRRPPLLGYVTVNDRITHDDWMQNTRHLRIHVTTQMASHETTVQETTHVSLSLPYQAADVATIVPSNPPDLVSKFLSILPPSIGKIADTTLRMEHHRIPPSNHSWPRKCTLRGLLTHCADLQSLPEQEDLYALSVYCNLEHTNGKDQRDKLISLSETEGAALYTDYILRNKRNWVDLFYDFDSLFYMNDDERDKGSHKKTMFVLSALVSVLPSIAPRHFSIASAPSFIQMDRPSGKIGFELELCVAVVEGTTSLGRSYSGCCSSYLASIAPCPEIGTTNEIRLWITPGSFQNLPLNPSSDVSADRFFETPILCVGAGTGIAPLRSLIFEREAIRLSRLGQKQILSKHEEHDVIVSQSDNTLVFGCRKRSMDYYYGLEWELLVHAGRLRFVPAFSRERKEKLYVQRALRETDQGLFIAHHILERQGAVYIAGGSKMARAVKDEIVEALSAVLECGNSDAKKLLNRLKRKGLFTIEAWS